MHLSGHFDPRGSEAAHEKARRPRRGGYGPPGPTVFYYPSERGDDCPLPPPKELPRPRFRRTSENTPSTHSAEYRSNSQGATYECAPRRPRRAEDPETERRIRYNAFPNAPTERSGWVLGEDRNTNATTNGTIRVLLADDHTLFREGFAVIVASYNRNQHTAPTRRRVTTHLGTEELA